MTGTHTQNSVFSRITFAMMEDTGWYRADYSHASPLDWGRGLGCQFAQTSCKQWINSQRLRYFHLSHHHHFTPLADYLNHSSHLNQSRHINLCRSDLLNHLTTTTVLNQITLVTQVKLFIRSMCIHLNHFNNWESVESSVKSRDCESIYLNHLGLLAWVILEPSLYIAHLD